MTKEKIYGVDDFLRAFGADPGDRAVIEAEASRYDFAYQRLDQDERDAVILGVLRACGTFTQVGEHRHGIWEAAWSDLCRRYDDSGEDLDALDPPFMGATPVLRLDGDYARPRQPAFETHWFRVLRHWMFHRWLQPAQRVFEFGCGSGFNLVALAQRQPRTQLVGLDWSPSVVDLMNRVGQRHGLNLTGRSFDFFNPSADLEFGGEGDVAMTFCALEQVGDRFGPFVDWLLQRRPGLVMHMEPALELYDDSKLFDDLAIRFHKERRYLNGFFPRLRQLEAEGAVEILCCRRLGFGSLYHEGYSLMVWRPL